MRILGELSLLVAFVGSGYSAFACFLFRRRPWVRVQLAGVAAALASLVALSITLAVLAGALLVKDFHFEYVGQYSSRLLPWHYSLSALWVGQAGSLLLWTWLLAVLSFLFLYTVPHDSRLRYPSFGLLMCNVCFLTAIMVFAADPMKASVAVRSEGLGLSPLLQHPSMLIHPPVVFLAYAAWAIPFALATSALITGDLDDGWTRLARPWALFAWSVLGAGLLLGANWAYQELGWGGYWGWDPVENGSLIPWLTGTALIHGLMAWRYRGCLKKLAVSLAISTFGLCNFATFLTRSGIFSSVHAFSRSPIGWMFLGLMTILLVAGATLVWMRRRELAPERPLGSIFSREALLLFSAFLLLILTSVVLVGTLFIPLSKLITGRMAQVGPSFYNNVVMPIGILLLGATALVPLLRWGSAPQRAERNGIWIAMLLACVATGIAAYLGIRHLAALAVTGLSVLSVCVTLIALSFDARRQGNFGFWRGLIPALRKHRRQNAAYTIHLAFVCLAVGITGSSLGTRRQEVQAKEGEMIEWAGRRIELVKLIQRETDDKLIAEAELRVGRGKVPPVTLVPARHFHQLQNEWTSEVAIHSSWTADFYVILDAGLGDGQVALTMIENPLMRWIWVSGWLGAAGVVVVAWPTRQPSIRTAAECGDQNPLGETIPATRQIAA
jgi:cytochrome c-type biogenesis protein CcmF